MEAIRDASTAAEEEYFTFRKTGFEGSLNGGGLYPNIITQNPRMLDILASIPDISAIDSTVLIIGETGTGKELIAAAIHASSGRRNKPFVTLNCSAIPEELFESELFGHKRGAFTGATEDKKGFIQMADSGSILLDEIGEMPLRLQAKLLRVIEEQKVTPVGSDKSVKIDVRVIAATNKNLEIEIERGNFREDLYYRLNVIPIALPPLRKRREDIPLLAGYFMTKFSAKFGRTIKIISKEAMKDLVNHRWHGNIRELRNVIERAVALEKNEAITEFGLFHREQQHFEGEGNIFEIPLGRLKEIKTKTIEALEKDYIAKALGACSGRIGEAAKQADMDIKNFSDKMKKYGIRKESYSK